MIFKSIRSLSFSVCVGFAALGLVAAGSVAHAAKAETHTSRIGNVAVDGHDPVAYFKVGEPTKGTTQFKTTYKGAEYRFASAENLALFSAAPAKYAPQYGGYCAWAAAQGYTAPGRAAHWRIVDGKLYLNFNAKVQSDWEKDIPGFIKKANANWPGVLAK
jgi:YHS domain-containing protein